MARPLPAAVAPAQTADLLTADRIPSPGRHDDIVDLTMESPHSPPLTVRPRNASENDIYIVREQLVIPGSRDLTIIFGQTQMANFALPQKAFISNFLLTCLTSLALGHFLQPWCRCGNLFNPQQSESKCPGRGDSVCQPGPSCLPAGHNS